MDYLWTPWRMAYIQSYRKNDENCVFCEAAERADGPENLIVFRGLYNYVILNRYPYTSGHVMVVPFRHAGTLEALDAPSRAELIELSNQVIVILQHVYMPQGFNLGINLGDVAGAGILDHVHMHVVPRWGGDTNFMSTLAGTRVLPETLEDSYSRISAAWNKG